jgi:hypothetical protein
MLNIPEYPEEALIWCGPAAAQMIMNGYPTGKCYVFQEDIWMSIQGHKVETMWDTDPVGLKEAMKTLCAPADTWVVKSKTNPQQLMHSIAYWMTKNSYPVAVLLNTLPHNSYTTHAEHWIVIRGIVTDKDPTTNSSVQLKFVWLNDPAVTLGDPCLVRYISGSAWYSEFQSVTKTASSYSGKYVAIIEPPSFLGIAIAPVEILRGRIISPEEALKFADQWIRKYKLHKIETYKNLENAIPLNPLLVNKEYGGYYIIPYTTKRKSRHVSAAVLINAYNGNFQEVGVFKPVKFKLKREAISDVMKYLKVKKVKRIKAELIFPMKISITSRYFPIWKIKIDDKQIYVNRKGKIFIKLEQKRKKNFK